MDGSGRAPDEVISSIIDNRNPFFETDDNLLISQ